MDEAGMEWLEDGCWADPLSRKERRELAQRLARASKRSYAARIGLAKPGTFDLAFDVVSVSAEMADLYTDVKERAVYISPLAEAR